MNTLSTAFDIAHQQSRLALVGYLPAGYPNPQRFLESARLAFESGLDVLEIGLPANNASLDGDVIRTALESLNTGGLSIEDALSLGGEALKESLATGIVMVYSSEIRSFGSQNLLQACVKAGIDGVLPVGMHPSDWPGFARAARGWSVSPVAFVSTQAGHDQLNNFSRLADGFLYLQSQDGPTGQQGDFGSTVRDRIAALRDATRSNPLPVAVGFGIRRPEDIAQVAALGADGAVVGTALVEAAADSTDAVCELVSRLSEAAQSAGRSVT
jgi:tryptophan synthase alpha chain